MKKFALYLLVIFYLAAGINHFWHPAVYLKLIPPYLPYPEVLNYLAGCFEIILAIMVGIPKTRYLGAMGIIAMLLAFIPAHIYFITIVCPGGDYCAWYWLAWGRLLIVHPLLIAWAWLIRK